MNKHNIQFGVEAWKVWC